MVGYPIKAENKDKMNRIRDISATYVELSDYGIEGDLQEKIIDELYNLACDIKMNKDYVCSVIDYKQLQEYQEKKQQAYN